jgi:PilZ domain
MKAKDMSSLCLDEVENRRFQRVTLKLKGRMMCADKREFDLCSVNISPGNMHVESRHHPILGENLVLYMQELGRLEGEVTRLNAADFAIALHVSEHKREKLANQLTWLANRHLFSPVDSRQYPRVAPRHPSAMLTLFKGSKVPCEVLDISYSGAALKLAAKPNIDDVVQLNGQVARVVRLTAQGCAVRFAPSASQAIYSLANSLGADL